MYLLYYGGCIVKAQWVFGLNSRYFLYVLFGVLAKKSISYSME